MTEACLDMIKVSKTYGSGDLAVQAITNVSLTIQEGEFVVIMGPSGSGKSTLLNLMAMLDNPTSGEVYYKGLHISNYSENQLVDLRRNSFSFVFQFFNLHPTLTAAENVELPMLFNNQPLKERRQRVNELLGLVGLEEFVGHKPHELSGGQQQRVGIARALANNQPLIFADEPTGSLDVGMARTIMNLLLSLNKPPHSKTIVMVSHDETILEKGLRRIILEGGVIKEDQVLSNLS